MLQSCWKAKNQLTIDSVKQLTVDSESSNKLPITDYRLPIPNSQFPITNSQFPLLSTNLK